jgi:pilus assembly protein Flp/PilA
MNRRRQFWSDDEGTTSVEYAIMLAMILLVLIVGVTAFGTAQNGYWGKIDNEMTAHGLN